MTSDKNAIERPTDPNFIAQATAEEMLSRLDLMTLQPKTIVVLGAEPDLSVDLLKKRYPAAVVLQEKGDAKKIVTLDALSVDLIFANLHLAWCEDLKSTLQFFRHLLRPDGLLMFTTLGPDTVVELHEKNLQDMLLYLIDMHDVGDEVVRAGFLHPVLDSEYVKVQYRELARLVQELQAMQIIAQDAATLHLQPTPEMLYSLTFEIIYGHAFGPAPALGVAANAEGIVKFPLDQLRKTSKNP